MTTLPSPSDSGFRSTRPSNADVVDPHRFTGERIRGARFATAFRGVDPAEVKTHLESVASAYDALLLSEALLRDELAALRREASAADAERNGGPNSASAAATDDRLAEIEALRSTAQAEADTVVAAARNEASAVIAKANDEAARIVLRARAESRGRPSGEALSVVEAAAMESGDPDMAREQAKLMVAEARAVRERVLTDLAKRRRVAHVQLEQMRVAREKLVESLREARRLVDDAARDLSTAEVEARLAAETAGRRVNAEPLPTSHELETELLSGRPLAATIGLTVDRPWSAAPAVPAAATVATSPEVPAQDHVAETLRSGEPAAHDEVLLDEVVVAEVAAAEVAAADGAVLDAVVVPVEVADVEVADVEVADVEVRAPEHVDASEAESVAELVDGVAAWSSLPEAEHTHDADAPDLAAPRETQADAETGYLTDVVPEAELVETEETGVEQVELGQVDVDVPAVETASDAASSHVGSDEVTDAPALEVAESVADATPAEASSLEADVPDTVTVDATELAAVIVLAPATPAEISAEDRAGNNDDNDNDGEEATPVEEHAAVGDVAPRRAERVDLDSLFARLRTEREAAATQARQTLRTIAAERADGSAEDPASDRADARAFDDVPRPSLTAASATGSAMDQSPVLTEEAQLASVMMLDRPMLVEEQFAEFDDAVTEQVVLDLRPRSKKSGRSRGGLRVAGSDELAESNENVGRHHGVASEQTETPINADDASNHATDDDVHESFVIGPLQLQLTRALKRYLQDEQSSVLASIRTSRQRLDLDVLVGDAASHRRSLMRVVEPVIADAARAGAYNAGTSLPAAEVAVRPLVENAVDAVMVELRREVSDELSRIAAPEVDRSRIVDSVSACYRRWTVDRLTDATRDVLLRAYGVGLAC